MFGMDIVGWKAWTNFYIHILTILQFLKSPLPRISFPLRSIMYLSLKTKCTDSAIKYTLFWEEEDKSTWIYIIIEWNPGYWGSAA